jgi:hypothetical protein
MPAGFLNTIAALNALMAKLQAIQWNNAPAFKKVAMFDMTNLVNARDVHHDVAASLTKPITSDPQFYQLGKSGGGGPTVQGHKLTAIVVQNKQQMIEALKSAEGEQVIMDMVKRRRVDIGINT